MHSWCLIKVLDEELVMVIKLRFGGEPWLRGAENKKIETPIVEGLEDVVVNDLMVPRSCEWDVDLVNNMFCVRDT